MVITQYVTDEGNKHSVEIHGMCVYACAQLTFIEASRQFVGATVT